MLRGFRIDCLGICTELKGNWREELLGNSCGSSANSRGITGELVGTSWEIIWEFVWKLCELVWYYWGTSGDFVGYL